MYISLKSLNACCYFISMLAYYFIMTNSIYEIFLNFNGKLDALCSV